MIIGIAAQVHPKNSPCSYHPNSKCTIEIGILSDWQPLYIGVLIYKVRASKDRKGQVEDIRTSPTYQINQRYYYILGGLQQLALHQGLGRFKHDDSYLIPI